MAILILSVIAFIVFYACIIAADIADKIMGDDDEQLQRSIYSALAHPTNPL